MVGFLGFLGWEFLGLALLSGFAVLPLQSEANFGFVALLIEG